MKKLFTSIMLLTCLQGFSQWISLNGPGGGTVPTQSFAVRDNGSNPDDIFVFSGDNIYRSVNEGLTWTETNGNGLPFTSSASLAVSGNYLFAAIAGFSNVDAGVFVSTDNGNNWAAANNGLPVTAAMIKNIIVQGNNVFAGSTYNQGVFVSSDNGQNWTAVNTGLTNKYIYTFFVDGNNLYAGTGNGLFVTSNGGQSWTSVSNGLAANYRIYSMVKNNTGFFVLAYNNSSATYQIYYSNDNAATWTQLNSSFATYFTALATDGTNVYVSCDGDGVYKTSGNGQNWTAQNSGLVEPHATLVSSLLYNNGKLYAGTNQKGVFTSSDSAATWQHANNGLSSTPVTSLAFIGDSLIAGTSGSIGVYFYNQSNQNWSSPIPLDDFYANVIKSMGVHGNSIFAGDVNGLFVSHDRGQTWNKDINVGNTITTVTVVNDTIYLGCDNTTNAGVLRSVNNGGTWVPVSNGMTTNRVSCLAMDNNAMYAGTSGYGVFKSTDKGANWTAVNNGLTDLAVKCIFLHNNVLFAGTGGSPTGGLYISSDGGLNWSAVSTSSGITNLNIRAFAGAGTTVFAAVGAGTIADAGVYASNDNGATWTYSDIGRHKAVSCLYVSNNYLYAGTNWGGVMKAPLNTVAITEMQPENQPFFVYPNPAHDLITLTIQTPFTENRYKVYDVTGREVLNGFINENTGNLDIKELQKGLYIVRVFAGRHVETARFLKF